MGDEATEPRKVLMSPFLMEQWASRDLQGRRLLWDWGKPDAEGFYTPTVTVDGTEEWRDHIPSGYDDMIGYGQVSCSCGWDSGDEKLGWEEHIDAAGAAAEKMQEVGG